NIIVSTNYTTQPQVCAIRLGAFCVRPPICLSTYLLTKHGIQQVSHLLLKLLKFLATTQSYYTPHKKVPCRILMAYLYSNINQNTCSYKMTINLYFSYKMFRTL